MRVVKGVDEMEEVDWEDDVRQLDKADCFLSRLAVGILVHSKVILDVLVSTSSVEILHNQLDLTFMLGALFDSIL